MKIINSMNLRSKKMNKFVFYFTLLFCVSCSAEDDVMRKQYLTKILESSLTQNDYLNSLKEADSYEFKRIDNKYINDFEVYKFVDMDPSGVDTSFIFAVNMNRDELYLLTESIDNYNKVISAHTIGLNEKEINEFVIASFSILRPPYKFFEIIDSKEKADEWLINCDSDKIKPAPLSMKNVSKYKSEGSVLILVGMDLVKREVAVKEGKLSFSDIVISKNISRYGSPHNYN